MTKAKRRSNARLLRLPYDLIKDFSETVASSINSYIENDTLQRTENFVCDISSERHVDGSHFDRPLIVSVNAFSEEWREEIEDEYETLAFITKPDEFVMETAGFTQATVYQGEEEIQVNHIFLFLNMDVDTEYFFVDASDVYSLLIHEWVHMTDKKFRKPFVPRTTTEYRNMSSEILAYSQQIVNEVRKNRQIYEERFRNLPNGIVDFLNSYSLIWQEIESDLNRRNRNKILSYAYTELYD